MRQTVIIIICLFFGVGWHIPVAADEALRGQVQSLDRIKGIMLLVPEGQTREIKVSFDPDQLPGFVREGEMVRVWGEFDTGQVVLDQGALSQGSSSQGFLFRASSICGRDMGGQNDPTGVRSRIGRGRQGFGRGLGGGGGRGGGGGGRR